MKKFLYWLTALAVLYSCSDKDDPVAVGAEGIEMRLEAFAFASGESFDVKWSERDTVGIFPAGGGMQLYFPMLSGAGQSEAQFGGEGWNLRQADNYKAYFPFQGNTYLDSRAIDVSYSGQVQDGNAPTAHLKKYDLMAASSERQPNGSMTFDFKHLGCLLELELQSASSFVPDHVDLLMADSLLIETGTADLLADSVHLTAKHYTDSLAIGLRNIKLGGEQPSIKIFGMLAPLDFRGHELKVKVVDHEGFFASFNLEGDCFEAGHIYRVQLNLEADPENSTTRSIHVEEAGTLKELLGKSEISNIKELKLSGELNGSDIRILREIAGINVNGKGTNGRLQVLDMRKARIVEGGDTYLETSDYDGNEIICRTENDVIGKSFFESSVLQRISLPETTKKIGEEAFVYCHSLKEIDMPEGLKIIGKEAFCLCDALTDVEIPESVDSLETGIFFLCSNLVSVHFKGNNLRTLPGGTFNQCTRLREVNIPASVETIGSTAFGYCFGLPALQLPKNLKEMGNTVFYSCYALKELTFPGNQIVFGKEVLDRCFDLNTLRFCNGNLNSLSGNFMGNNGVTTLYLPDSLKEIKGTVLGNESIQEVYCFAIEPPVIEVGNLPNPECKIYVPAESVEKYRAAAGWKEHAKCINKIPEGVNNDWK